MHQYLVYTPYGPLEFPKLKSAIEYADEGYITVLRAGRPTSWYWAKDWRDGKWKACRKDSYARQKKGN